MILISETQHKTRELNIHCEAYLSKQLRPVTVYIRLLQLLLLVEQILLDHTHFHKKFSLITNNYLHSTLFTLISLCTGTVLCNRLFPQTVDFSK